MLAKIWKKLFLIICIIAIIINIGHKLVSRTTLKEQLIQLATTESLSTSIKNFVKEKYGEMTDNEKNPYSNPVGEIVDVFSKDKNGTANDDSNTANSNDDMNTINADNTVNDGVDVIDGENADNNADENANSEGNRFTRFVQNIKTDIDDNPYFNDDPTDDLIDTTPPSFN